MATYTIDRRTWYRGKGDIESKLLRPDGMRCCIGQIAQQCGVADASILHEPAVVRKDGEAIAGKWPAWFLGSGGQSYDLCECYEDNDNRDLTEVERERRLTETFAKHGDTLVFVN